jgi:hypothetical protein
MHSERVEGLFVGGPLHGEAFFLSTGDRHLEGALLVAMIERTVHHYELDTGTGGGLLVFAYRGQPSAEERQVVPA